jgi:hypothetical protein
MSEHMRQLQDSFTFVTDYTLEVTLLVVGENLDLRSEDETVENVNHGN